MRIRTSGKKALNNSFCADFSIATALPYIYMYMCVHSDTVATPLHALKCIYIYILLRVSATSHATALCR